mmetsp:Transcript_12990/g.36850  ORF Transcript_12990/g.36850 Transcript_12990/m.36850 type:complete len:647 (+) Transcript_12990:384-2324(+)
MAGRGPAAASSGRARPREGRATRPTMTPCGPRPSAPAERPLPAPPLLLRLGVHLVLRHDCPVLGQNGRNLLRAHRLPGDELPGERVECLPVLEEDPLAARVGALHQPAHLGVDESPGLGGHLRGRRATLAAAQCHLADALGHAVLRHHGLGDRGHALEVVGGAGGDFIVAEDDLFSHTAAQRHCHGALEVLPAVEAGVHAVLAGGEEGEAPGAPARGDGDLRDLVVVWGEGADDGVAGLVVGDELALLGRDVGRALLLGAEGHPVERVADLLVPDLGELLAGGEDGRLVQEVRQHRAGESRRPAGDRIHVDAVFEGLAPGVDTEDGLAAQEVGEVDHDPAVEAARAEQGGVQHVGAVRGAEHDDAGVALEAVHLGEDLVEGLLALVVAHPLAAGARAPDGVDLVDEDDAGRVLLGLLEEVAHAGRADADEHLDELGARHGEEGHASLAGDGPGEERLAGAGGALEEHPAGDLRAQRGEALRLLQEHHDLLELCLGAVDTHDVVEGHAGVRLHLNLGLRLAEVHGVPGAPEHAEGLEAAPHAAGGRGPRRAGRGGCGRLLAARGAVEALRLHGDGGAAGVGRGRALHLHACEWCAHECIGGRGGEGGEGGAHGGDLALHGWLSGRPGLPQLSGRWASLGQASLSQTA